MSKKLGEVLVEKGLLTLDVVELGLEAQRYYGGRLGSILVELEALDEKSLVETLCEMKGSKPARAGQLKSVTQATLDTIPRKIAERYQVVPLERENRRLVVAITDPGDLLALDELQFVTGCVVEPVLASERTVLNALERYYGIERKRLDTTRLDGLRAQVARAQGRMHADDIPVFSQAVAKPEDGEETEAEQPPEVEKAKRFWAAEDGEEDPERTRAIPAQQVDEEPEAEKEATDTGVLDGNDLLLSEGSSTLALEEHADRTIEEASRRLARAEIRDDIADVILWCTEELFARSSLFIFQKSQTIGWTGQGRGLSPAMVRKVVTPVEKVSVFTLVRDTAKHYLGPLPDTPANQELVDHLGGERPEAVLVIPFGIKGRPIGCFYAEDAGDELAAIDLHLLFRLLRKAGLALEMLLLRTKIVML